MSRWCALLARVIESRARVTLRPCPILGERSAIDLYLSVMTRWRPRRPWFAATCPRVHAAATAIDREPRLAALWAEHFGA